MIKQNSSGYGQPKNKTLDVEVNLLAEWAMRKERSQAQTTRALTQFTILLLLAVVTFPLLLKAQFSAASRAAIAHRHASAASSDRSALEGKLKNLEPVLDAQKLKESLKGNCDRFFGETALLLNSAGDSMVFSSLKADALGGKMTLRCQADGVNSQAAQDFIAKAGAGGSVTSSLLTSIRRNAAIGPTGVTFEYIKIVEVAK